MMQYSEKGRRVKHKLGSLGTQRKISDIVLNSKKKQRKRQWRKQRQKHQR